MVNAVSETAPRLDEQDSSIRRPDLAEPGLVMVFACGQPYCTVLSVGAEPLELGRGQGILQEHADSLMSRRHARIVAEPGGFLVEDLGSRNGSAVAGVPLLGSQHVASDTLVRFGGTLFLLSADIRPFRQLGVKRLGGRAGGQIQGPQLQTVFQTVCQAATTSRVLHISGESGAGKELIAHAFHQSGPTREGSFVSVNCAAIPAGIAERLLFGARKGAFSGIEKDSEGYFAAADTGTLFLDEVGDLELSVQGKVLRVLETGELLPLGANRPRRVQLRICTATHNDLRQRVQTGAFRADLYFRIGIPEVIVPPLRNRREEIPWLMMLALEATTGGLSLHPGLVELCMLRPWPGNVRELLAETQAAALRATAQGVRLITVDHLRPCAGERLLREPKAEPAVGLQAENAPNPSAATPENSPPAAEGGAPPQRALPSRAQIVAALMESGGNLSAGARLLGLHRTQLRRLLVQHQIDVNKVRQL